MISKVYQQTHEWQAGEDGGDRYGSQNSFEAKKVAVETTLDDAAGCLKYRENFGV